MFDNLRDEYFVLVFGILFIEDAVGFVAETDAGEEMGRSSKTIIAIYKIITVFPSGNRKETVLTVSSSNQCII